MHATSEALMGMLRLLHVLVLIIARVSLVDAQNGGTTFSYPPFNTTSNLLFGGDAKIYVEFVYGGSEVRLNTGGQVSLKNNGSCASLLYGEPLQMQGSNSSFTTAFTFSIVGTHSAGFAFVLLPQNHTIGIPGGKLCLMPRALDPISSRFFAVEFDTFKNPEFNDPSNNHVGVNVNSMNSTATYNLCADGVEECSYLMSDSRSSIVHEFTSWVDYDSVTKTVAVFLMNGSTLESDISKPASAIIQASVDLSDVIQSENVFVGFSASTTYFDSEVKRIMSWRFSTGATHVEGSPTLGPGSSPRAPSPSPAGTIGPAAAPSTGGSPTPTLGPGSNNGSWPRAPSSSPAGTIGPAAAAAPSTGGTSGSNEYSKVKLAGGITVVGVAGLLAIAILYKLFRLFRRPLRFFLSHAGGDHEEGKNFPDWLYDKMTESWKLKRFIKVFLDRRSLKKGKEFAAEIKQALDKTEVGMVVVTPEFFIRRWPMTELVSFVRSQEYDPSVRILPLFYQMSVAQVRDHLRNDETWDDAWTKMFGDGKHQILPGDCRAAVEQLCKMNGIVYTAKDRGNDREYIKLILKDVGRILREGLWKR